MIDFRIYKLGSREYRIYENGVIMLGDKVISQSKDKDGYMIVSMWDNVLKKSLGKKVHRLVAESFIPNPDNKKEVNHIDRKRDNNNVSNLEWVDRKENVRHSMKFYIAARTGSKNGRARLKEEDVLDIREKYKNGTPVYILAKEFNVGWSTVNNIILRNTWKQI